MNFNEAQQLLSQLSETNNINDLNFKWPKEAIPSAFPLDDADGSTRDINRLLDVLAIMKPINGCRRALSHRDIIRVIELLNMFPADIVYNLKQRLSQMLDDSTLISEPPTHQRRIDSSKPKDQIPQNQKYRDLIHSFNHKNSTQTQPLQ